jgi:hypothetical protein
MKKLIFSILSLGVLLISSASGDGFCQNWEAGQIIRPDQPNGSVAPKPYCWQVSDLQGAVNISGTMYLTGNNEDNDEGVKVQGRNDSYYNFYGFYEDYVYGEMYRGMYVFVEVYGFPQNTPTVTFNNLSAILKGTDDVKSLSGNTLNGTRYKFFIPIKTVASTVYWSDIDLSGRVNIFDGVNLKREFTIF